LRRLFLSVLFLSACHQSQTPDPPKDITVDRPLTSFQQVLTTSTTKLTLHPNQETRIPVNIKNSGQETWASNGKYPVTISYKWYKDGQMLPIEGERTGLPTPVGPNQSVDANVRVVPPNQAGTFTLRITLVQEAVAWFMLKSNTYLELPAIIE
jgi:uncharacterized protein YcfL